MGTGIDTPQHVRDFTSMSNRCVTLGPLSVAAFCEIVRASYYVPYLDGVSLALTLMLCWTRHRRAKVN